MSDESERWEERVKLLEARAEMARLVLLGGYDEQAMCERLDRESKTGSDGS